LHHKVTAAVAVYWYAFVLDTKEFPVRDASWDININVTVKRLDTITAT
jgi:hypothetical protein